MRPVPADQSQLPLSGPGSAWPDCADVGHLLEGGIDLDRLAGAAGMDPLAVADVPADVRDGCVEEQQVTWLVVVAADSSATSSCSRLIASASP
jgi:hypothetical protein